MSPDPAPVEEPVVFSCEGENLLGILHHGDAHAEVGVVLIVGGPQYRVGSHRQFVLVSRALAAHGFPSLRFDYRGMGDSTGEARRFEAVGTDIGCAIDLLQRHSGAKKIVLWGLCDAASAALMYAASDPRVVALVLLNPWVHTDATEAAARLGSYYGERLTNRDFWRKLLGLKLNWADSLQSLIQVLKNAGRSRLGGHDAALEATHFLARMQRGWERFSGRVFLILSGQDLTADEFRSLIRTSPAWQRLRETRVTATLEVKQANHTFSSQHWRGEVEDATVKWLKTL